MPRLIKLIAQLAILSGIVLLLTGSGGSEAMFQTNLWTGAVIGNVVGGLGAVRLLQ